MAQLWVGPLPFIDSTTEPWRIHYNQNCWCCPQIIMEHDLEILEVRHRDMYEVKRERLES
jgi:hypothetical protein